MSLQRAWDTHSWRPSPRTVSSEPRGLLDPGRTPATSERVVPGRVAVIEKPLSVWSRTRPDRERLRPSGPARRGGPTMSAGPLAEWSPGGDRSSARSVPRSLTLLPQSHNRSKEAGGAPTARARRPGVVTYPWSGVGYEFAGKAGRGLCGGGCRRGRGAVPRLGYRRARVQQDGGLPRRDVGGPHQGGP